MQAEPEASSEWDCYIQTANQDTASKLVAYALATDLHVYPEHFAAGVEEVGPHTEHKGPCLALFRGLRSTPECFLSWLGAHPFLKRHIHRVFTLPQCNGKVLSSREELIQDICEYCNPDTVLRINAFPKNLEAYIKERLPPSFHLDAQNFSGVLMALEVGHQLRWAVVPPSVFFRQSCDVPKVFEGSAASAVNKIHEAIEVLGLHQCKQQMRAVIDVGAAPGSWTSFLAATAESVVAIDPAELSPDVAALPNVHHLKMMSQDPQIASAISQALGSEKVLVDVLTCDMNSHPFEACRAVKELIRFLKPGGICIMTLKCRGMGRDRSITFSKLKDFFGDSLEDPPRCIWLLANTKFEATFVGKKK
ncbi:hypothetical protein DUNSADRAFT_599 [Dunaliella salina]|uniref:Ribosomal RNA methyltransferase FtsJ domain-containing protein n=1 Tax=Dunaliella salina TaxID=3046 RepID=A0ABQ7GY43_DUNSA|nr:hypothetical protein DUNSADRAFT_599 [Dunaliella salina]|eukprot:KAF5839527.1 hypothetical protein DUNSADRAFT_599 [Dunaliella salina]